MSTERATMVCKNHGTPPEAFLCQHLMRTLNTGVAVGFHWPAVASGPTPDAWCNECEAARVDAGGDWTDEVLENVGIRLVCASCYLRAKQVWLNARRADGLGAL